MGRSDDVPHFNRTGHFRTQEYQELRRQSRRRRGDNFEPRLNEGMFINFAFVGGIIMLAVVIPSLLVGIPARGQEGADKSFK